MKRLLIRCAVPLIVATGVAGLVACSPQGQGPAGPPDRVVIACATPPYTALVDVAVAKGYFRQEGLDVVQRFHSAGKGALDDVLAGTADIATVGETPLMFAILDGKMISVIATIHHSNKTVAILARKDEGILSPKDLKGKRIGAAKGTGAEYFLAAFLASHGMAGSDAIVVNLKPEETVAALASGRIDAAATWDPILNDGKAKLGGKAVVFSAEEIYTQTINLAAPRAWISVHPAAVKKILHALVRAEEFARREPVAAQRAIADLRGIDPALLAAIWADHSFAVSLDQSLILVLEDEARWAVRNKLTKAAAVPNFLECISTDGLQAVAPKAVRILR